MTENPRVPGKPLSESLRNPTANCLVCGQEGELVTWVDPVLAGGRYFGVCFECRDAGQRRLLEEPRAGEARAEAWSAIVRELAQAKEENERLRASRDEMAEMIQSHVARLEVGQLRACALIARAIATDNGLDGDEGRAFLLETGYWKLEPPAPEEEK